MSENEDKKLETPPTQTLKSPYMLQIVSLAILAALMVMPFGMDKMNLLNYEQTPQLLYPFTALFSGLVQKEFYFFISAVFPFFIACSFSHYFSFDLL
ncbi:hypothetical protein [Treponema sp. OMZ 838]|uniref:hypothetical protein n=1 Tax=Treponema sp. OMZ 838 TaxID=1539298 RepID=UPI000AE79FA8|nr:hypothetical protein [Treponema sp. OMZ 838]